MPIISIQQNIPETDKVKFKNKNVFDDVKVNVKGQFLPRASFQKNIPGTEKTKTEKAKIGKTLVKKLEDTVAETATQTMVTQTEKRCVTEAFTDKANNQIKEAIGNVEKSGRSTVSTLSLEKDISDETDACNFEDEDQESTGDKGLQMGMSELYLMKPDFSSENAAVGLPGDMQNDALSLVNIKIGNVAETFPPGDAGKAKASEEVVAQENKTKIAWVTLGTCPVCKTDLNSVSANKPCHIKGAMENETDNTLLEEIGEEETERVTCMQSNVSIASLSGECLIKAEKIDEKEGISAKLESFDGIESNKDVEAVCSDKNVIEMNISNNALPKRPVDSQRPRQTRAAEYDSNLPCEECHDVQPSESDRSVQIQQRENTDDQSVGATSRNEEETQSRSESSGAC